MRGKEFLSLLGTSLLCLLQPGDGKAQEWQRSDIPSFIHSESPFLFYEATSFPTPAGTEYCVDIGYRIDLAFLIPVRSSDQADQFVRRGEVVIELLDSLGASRARDLERFEMGTIPANSEAGEWHQGIMSFKVEPGTYVVAVGVEDLESDRRFLEQNRRIRVGPSSPAGLRTSTPLFVTLERDSVGLSTFLVQNYGGGIKLGETGVAIVLEIANAHSGFPVRVEYSVSVHEEQRAGKVVLSDTLDPVDTFNDYSLTGRPSADGVRYSLTPSDQSSVISIPLPSGTLPLRPYLLDLNVSQNDLEQRIKTPFQIVWPTMPLSLRDLDYAVGALRFLLSASQLDSLGRGNDLQVRENLERFWAPKDRTPQTALNEVMTEYYRRVDHAARTFGSLNEPDGTRTDRGRIYILHGPPTETERKLDPQAGYQEIWYYRTISKKFTFVDAPRTGNYVLTSTETL